MLVVQVKGSSPQQTLQVLMNLVSEAEKAGLEVIPVAALKKVCREVGEHQGEGSRR